MEKLKKDKDEENNGIGAKEVVKSYMVESAKRHWISHSVYECLK